MPSVTRFVRRLDPFWALLFVTFAVALLAIILAPVAKAALPEDEPLDASPEFQRALELRAAHAHADELAVQSALALVTPTPMWSPVEITSSGNVAVSGRPTIVLVVGYAPLALFPPACRHDAETKPKGTTMLCYPTDERSRWVRAE